MSVTQITFPPGITAAALAFEALVDTFSGDFAYIAAGALTPADIATLTNALVYDQMLAGKFDILGELAEKPGKVDSKTSGLRTRKFQVAGARANTLTLQLVGISQLQKKWLESPAFSSALATLLLRTRDKTRVIIFNGLKWTAEWSGETDGLFDVTLATEFAGATDTRIYAFKDIPAIGVLPGSAAEPFAAWDVSAAPETPFPLRTTLPLTLTCPTGFQASFTSGESFAASLDIPAGFDGYIWLSLVSTTPGEHSGNLSLAPAEGDPTLIPLTGYYGDGTASFPYPIAHASQLHNIRAENAETAPLLAAHYLQLCDISLIDYGRQLPAWVPIAPALAQPFSGSYDGGGFSITDLTVNPITQLDVHALFGHVTGTLTNIRLENASVTGHGAVALLVAALEGTASHCSASGSLTYNGPASGSAGGLVASASQNALLVNCHVSNLSLRSLAATATAIQLGAFAGSLLECYVYRCSASGSLVGPANYAGGFAGHIETSQINNCFATVTVAAYTRPNGLAGGFAGYSTDTTLAKCFCAGIRKTYAPLTSGAFFGTIPDPDDNAVSACFYNSDLTSLTDPQSDVLPLTTAEMCLQDTWDDALFDFVDVWIMPASGYPVLDTTNLSLADPENPE